MGFIIGREKNRQRIGNDNKKGKVIIGEIKKIEMDITQCDKESIDQIGDREPFYLVDSWQDVSIAARVRCGCFCFGAGQLYV
jgi:hypothetical protein